MVSENLKIEIRPIPNRKGIRELSDNLEYFSQANTISAFVNPVTRKYDTGLTKEDIEYLNKMGCPYNLDNNYIPGEPHEFWESQLVKTELINKPIFLYPGRSIIDFIKWKYLLVNNYIYSSEAEMNTGSKPQATHYIYDESEEIEVKATAFEKKLKLFKSVDGLSLEKKRQVVLLIEDEDTSTKADSYLTTRFEEILKDPDKTTLLETILDELKTDKVSVELKALVKKATYRNIIKRTKSGYLYFENNLGFSINDVVDFLAKDENQEILINLKDKLN